MIPEQHQRKVAAVVALCCAGAGAYLGVPGYEGLGKVRSGQVVAYRDASPQEIWTYCYGETNGVTKESRATPEQCKALLAKRIEGDFVTGVEKCITRAMPVKVEASFVSMAYNVGVYTFCHSSVARKWNAGDGPGACAAMRLYVHSGTKTLPGLVVRREGESGLCMEGLI